MADNIYKDVDQLNILFKEKQQYRKKLQKLFKFVFKICQTSCTQRKATTI